MIKFWVSGIPKSMKVGGVVRFRRGDTVHMAPKRGNSEWAVLVGHIGRQHAPVAPPADIGVALTVVFWMPRPATLPKRVRLPLKRPDLDNLFSKLTDQFNGVFWRDDSQIVDVVLRKRFARDGRVGAEFVIEPVYLEDVPRAPTQVELSEMR